MEPVQAAGTAHACGTVPSLHAMAEGQATRKTVELARGMQRLRGFVHVSTAYVNANLVRGSHVEERMYALYDAQGARIEHAALARRLAALPPPKAEHAVSRCPCAVDAQCTLALLGPGDDLLPTKPACTHPAVSLHGDHTSLHLAHPEFLQGRRDHHKHEQARADAVSFCTSLPSFPSQHALALAAGPGRAARDRAAQLLHADQAHVRGAGARGALPRLSSRDRAPHHHRRRCERAPAWLLWQHCWSHHHRARLCHRCVSRLAAAWEAEVECTLQVGAS